MIYILRNLVTGEEIVISEERTYSIGRQKQGVKKDDIILNNDASVSRNHAKLTVKDGNVTLADCKSRYHTFHEGTQLVPEQEVKLNVGDSIHFGILSSKFTFEACKYLVAASGLSSAKKSTLKNDLEMCGGKYTEKWSSSCTHLTVEKITLTIKVLQALIDDKPIVTLEYWEAYREHLNSHSPLPDINSYNRPKVAEQLLSSDFQLKANPKRKTLFKGKVFLFFKSNLKNQMEDVIKSCGGTCSAWEEKPITYKDIDDNPKEHIVIKTDDDNEEYKKIIENLSNKNKRPIALTEIALAIVHCSCDSHCNPNFDKTGHLFGQSKSTVETPRVLLKETQSENISKTMGVKTETIVPASVEEDWGAAGGHVNHEGQGVKRTRTEDNADFLFKKPRIKETEKETRSDSVDNSSVKIERLSPPREARTSQVEPTVAQKRKAEEELQNEEKKKLLNPFSIFKLGSKKKTSSQNNNDQDSQKTSIDTSEQLTPSTHSLEKLDNSKQIPLAYTSTPKDDNMAQKYVPLNTLKKEPKNDFSYRRSLGTSCFNDTWISKTSIIKPEISDIVDPEVAKISEAFKDCVQIKFLPEIKIKDRSKSVLKDLSLNVTNGFANFKKFKKVQPLKPQINIIGRHELKKVAVGNTAGINVDELDNIDDEDVIKVKEKPKSKKFLI